MNTLSYALVSVIVLFATGCSSPGSRIKDNESQFFAYPPQVQGQIQSGRIDVGFTPEMVYMAKGNPVERVKRTVGGKEVEIWKYPGPIIDSPSDRNSDGISAPYGYPTFGPGPSHPIRPGMESRRLYKVEFEAGKVVRWDAELQAAPGKGL